MGTGLCQLAVNAIESLTCWSKIPDLKVVNAPNSTQPRMTNHLLRDDPEDQRTVILTLPLKNVSLAEWFNSDKENENDENIKVAV
jgi:hypothetical protein